MPTCYNFPAHGLGQGGTPKSASGSSALAVVRHVLLQLLVLVGVVVHDVALVALGHHARVRRPNAPRPDDAHRLVLQPGAQAFRWPPRVRFDRQTAIWRAALLFVITDTGLHMLCEKQCASLLATATARWYPLPAVWSRQGAGSNMPASRAVGGRTQMCVVRGGHADAQTQRVCGVRSGS